MEIIDPPYRLLSKRDDEISDSNVSVSGRARRVNRDHQHPALSYQLVVTNQAPMNRGILPSDPQVSPLHVSISQQGWHDDLRRVDWDSEAESLPAHDDRRVEPDDLARGVDERAARVAGIQRGVGLNDVGDQAARLRPQRSTERADDPGGHRVLESIRIADRDDDLPSFQLIGFPELRRNDLRRVDLDDRQVGVWIVPDDASSVVRPSGSVTRSSRAPCATWLLVRISPSGVNTKPDPLPCAVDRRRPFDRVTSILTTDGLTRSTALVTAWE